MRHVRQCIGGLGNLMFKQAFLIGLMLDTKIEDVYLQGEVFWRQHKEEIKKYFGENIAKINKVALHIRRGDYLKADNFHVNLWETDYYKKAVKMFPNETFLVFCRDRQDKEQDDADEEWCKTNLDFLNIKWELAPCGDDETDDLNLMAGCKHIIMANSSFSWWAAYLNPHKPTVITPKRWFVDKIQRVELLDSWIQL